MSSNRDRTIAIGDIHGCFLALDTLLDRIEPKQNDILVILGDFIDQGTQTKESIDRLIDLRNQCQLVYLLGNHEEVLLNTIDDPSSLEYWMQCGGVSTLNSYRFGGTLTDIPEEHIEFIRKGKDYYETEDFIFCHATPDFKVPMDQNSDYALRWQLLEPTRAVQHVSGKTLIVGHTEQRGGEVLDLGFVRCIDTACWRYGWLTAMEVNSRQIWQAQRFGGLRSDQDAALGPLGGAPVRVG